MYRLFGVATLVVSFVLCTPISWSSGALAEAQAAVSPSALSAEQIILLTNQARQRASLMTVTSDRRLMQAAQAKAEAMAAAQHFAHALPDGRRAWDFMRSADYRYAHAGENLAIHFTSEKRMVQAWLASPTHRAVILNARYEHIGIGIARGEFQGHRGWYVVQILATEMRTTPAR